MFYTLINGEDGEIACTSEPAMVVDAMEVYEHIVVAVGRDKDAVNKIGAGRMQG